MNHIINNIEYKKIVPKHINSIVSMDDNPYYFYNFSKKIYKTISNISITHINGLYKRDNLVHYDEMDIFDTYKYDRAYNLELIASSYYSDEMIPFHISLVNGDIIADFINTGSLNDKMKRMTKRYCSFEVNICINNLLIENERLTYHSMLFVFDTKNRQAYICDSNNNMFLTYDVYLHNLFSEYCSMIDYKYIRLFDDMHIKLEINKKISSVSQKKFFQGYCRGWTLYFQYILNMVDNNFEILEYIRFISNCHLNILNEIIEIFQVYFYNNYLML